MKMKNNFLTLNISGERPSSGSNTKSNDILAMISPEGENVPLTKGLKARGNVEDWLGKKPSYNNK